MTRRLGRCWGGGALLMGDCALWWCKGVRGGVGWGCAWGEVR